MGRQVNFYMTSEDQNEFLEFMRSKADVALVPNKTILGLPRELSQFSSVDAKDEYFFSLWNKDISPAPALKYIEKQKHFLVNSDASEVIEFSRCRLEHGILYRGRIWADFKGLVITDSGESRLKSAAFTKWFNQMLAVRRVASV